MNNRLKSLDVLKGIGIIMIIIVHNRHFIMKDMEGCRGIINYGQMGCQIFFLVSGMALCCSWFCQLAQTPQQAFFKNYIIFTARRYFRLAPGFLIMLALNFILNTIIIDIFHFVPGFVMNRTLPAIITNIFFIHGFFPEYINDVFPGGWYIGTAFILYLIFPFLVSLCRKLCQINLRLLYVLPLIFLIANIFLLRYITKISGGDLYPGNNSFSGKQPWRPKLQQTLSVSYFRYIVYSDKSAFTKTFSASRRWQLSLYGHAVSYGDIFLLARGQSDPYGIKNTS